MQKKILIIGFMLLLIIASLSGCIDNINRAASDTGNCCVLGIIGVVLFIILIAYLLGGKKTVVQTQQYATPSPPIIIEQRPSPPTETHSKSKLERRCPSCGRGIPDDANLCPYCGKKFKTHFEEEYEEEPKIEKEEKTKKESKEKIKTPKFCPECGVKLDEGLDFCTNCGIKLK